MEASFADVNAQYSKDNNLKREDVQELIDWVYNQPHLPQINELQGIVFLKRCEYEIETSKSVIDSYFTVKSLCPDLFLKRNPSQTLLKEAFDLLLYTVLCQKTPNDESIIFAKMMNPDMSIFDITTQIKYFDMVCMLFLHQEGPSSGYQLVVDLKDFPVGILAKLNPLAMKKFLYYMQEAMPVRWTGIHYVNVVPFMDQLLGLIKPFMKKDLINMIHLHDSVHDLIKYIPIECLPQDYGGSDESCSVLLENVKSKLLANAAFFEWENQQIVEEKKRPFKPKTVNEIFGIEATFKKLELD